MFLTNVFNKPTLLLILIVLKETRSLTLNICINEITLIGSAENMAIIVDVNPGTCIHLACRFCSQRQKYQQVSWYYRKRGSNKTLSVKKKGYSLTNNYDLLLNNFTIDDSGVFSCKAPNMDEEGISTFILEAVYQDVDDKVGTFEEWSNYKSSILDPINRILSNLKIKITMEFSFRVFTAWDNIWGPCERTGSKEFKRRKHGRCRLHLIINQTAKKLVENNNINNKRIGELFLNDKYDVSCYSLYLRYYLPNISDLVRFIPQFVAYESCNMMAGNEATNLQQIESSNKTILKQVAERAYVVLTCPKSTLQSKVEWFKENKLINSNHSSAIFFNSKEPQVIIDSDSLYISHASKLEEGIYSCYINGRKMRTYDLKVISESALLNGDFFRYSIYLGFILSLTITCYCTGVCVAWHRKTSFADPLNVNNKNMRQ